MAWALSALALLSVVVTRGAQGFQCPKVAVQSLIADPEDCAKYYHCLPGGRLFVMRCPNGLVFDSRQKVCIWNSNALSCSSNELEPIKSHQIKDSATNTDDDLSSKGGHSISSHRNTTHENLSSNQPQNQVSKRKSVPLGKSRSDWSRRTTQTKFNPAPSATSQPSTQFSTSISTATTTTSTTQPETTESSKKTTNSTDFVETMKEVPEEKHFVSDSLATVGFDDDSRGRIEKEATGKKTVHSKRADENNEQPTSELRTSRIHSQGQHPHSVSKRSPDDNVVRDSVYCPTGYAYIADPSSCSAFYHCYNWQPMRKLCPPGLFFDVRMYVCNWPHNVDCFEGYRAKNVFTFSGRRRTYKKASVKTGSTSKKSRSGRRRPVFQRTGSLATTKVSTKWTTVASKPTMAVQVATTPERDSNSISEFLPSLQQFRDSRIYGRYSSFLPDSHSAVNVTQDLKVRTFSLYSNTPATLSLSPSTSKTPLSMTVMAFLPDQNMYDSQYHINNKAKLSNLEAEQMTPTAKLTSVKQQSRQTEDTAGVQLLSTEPEYDLSPSEKTADIGMSHVNSLPLKRPNSRIANLANSSRWDTANVFSWTVTSHLPHNQNVPEPSAGAVKRNNDSQGKNTKFTTEVVTTSGTALNTSVGSNNKASVWVSHSLTSSTKIPSGLQNAASKEVTERPTSRKAEVYRSASNSQLSMKTDSGHVRHTTTAVPSLSSSTSSTPQNSSQITITAGNSVSSPSTSISTTAAIAAFKYLLNTATAVSKKRIKPSVKTTDIPKTISTRKAHTTPITFTATRIPFYAMKNLRVQPITWMNTGRLPMASTAYWAGRRLRAPSHQTQRHALNTFPFSRPSLAAGTAYTPATLQLHKPVLHTHRDPPPEVQIDKFMIKLLNDDIPTNHVASSDVSHHYRSGEVTSIREKTTIQTIDTEVNKTEVVNSSKTEKSQPSAFADADKKEDFNTTKNTVDMKVSGKVITDMTASISTPSDVNDESMLKTQEPIISDPSNLSFSATSPMDDDGSDNLLIMHMNTDEVIDKHIKLQYKNKKGAKVLPETSDLSKVATQYTDVNHSGATDSAQSVPRIQPFSALAGQEQSNWYKPKGSSSSDSNTTPTKEQDVSLTENVQSILSDQPLANETAGEGESKTITEGSTFSITTLKSFTTIKLTVKPTGTSTQGVSANSSSAEITKNAVKTTAITNQRTTDCNITNCTSLQTKDNLTKTTMNVTHPSIHATPSKSFSTATTKAVPTPTSEAPYIEKSTAGVELPVAAEVLRAKDIMNGNRPDTLVQNNDMRTALEAVEPNHKKKTTQKIHTQNLSEPPTSVPKEISLKTDSSPFIQEHPDKSQPFPKSEKSLSGSDNETIEEKINNVPLHNSDTFHNVSNATDFSVSTPYTGDEEDDKQEVDDSERIAEHALYQDVTTMSQYSARVKNSSFADETENASPSSGATMHTTLTSNKSENVNSQSIVNSDFKMSVANENKTSANTIAAIDKNKTAFVATNEEVETNNISLSELLGSLILDEKNNITFLRSNDTSSLSDGLSAASENKTEILTTQNTRAQKVLTTQETQPTIATNENNTSVKSATRMPVNVTSVNSTEESKESSTAYLSQNTNQKERYTMNEADGHDSQYDHLKKSDISKVSVSLEPDKERQNINYKTTRNISAESTHHSNGLNKTDSYIFADSRKSTSTLAQQSLTFTNSKREAKTLNRNITTLNETVTANSSDISSQNVPETRLATTNSSENTSITSPTASLATTVKTELQDGGPPQLPVLVSAVSEDMPNTVRQDVTGSSEQSPPVMALLHVSNVKTVTSKATNNELTSPDEGKSSPRKEGKQTESHTKNVVTTVVGNTGSNRSFVSVTDLIAWYLKHSRNYLKWRHDQMTSPPTVTF